MKTAVTVLQEMMVKINQTPEYECIAQSGPQHSAMFEYRCSARGACVTAAARSKKEAKQEAARLMLLTIAARGEPVPQPYGLPRAGSSAAFTQSVGGRTGDGVGGGAAGGGGAGGGAVDPLDSRSYVALLKDLCEEYRLPGVEYELVGDTGPPHLRHFTVRVRVGAHTRLATATTKKAARQLAAHQLYSYLRENLARLTKDFVEEEALVRAHERAMERFAELREESPWRPDLGQKIADYHLGLLTHIEGEKRVVALDSLAAGEGAGAADEEEKLCAAAAALGLEVQWHELAAGSGRAGSALTVVELSPTAPALALAGTTRRHAAAAATRYLRLALTAMPSQPSPVEEPPVGSRLPE